jgi:REP element-mobilizing transposase RayT
MAKFKNKYRIESTRLQNWNYSRVAVYFITICTANRDHFFGIVKNNEMVYSDIGAIVAQEWVKTPEIRPDMNLELGEFMVMPNHFHGVIFIGNNEFNGRDAMHRVSTSTDDNIDAMHRVSTDDNIYKNEFGPQSKNLSSIIRGFKSAVTVQAKKINPDFGWQARFHDHIIRNPKSYDTISQYIIDNPKKWGEDEFHK